MASKKWLNIIVDGNSALGPYWPKIVSEYLEGIVRSFFDNSGEEGVHPTCQVGLVIYNANSDLGFDVQFINWTSDVDYFLGTLSGLAFNGDNQDNHTIVEGLAEALVMFPRPPNSMTIQEYYKSERHCILVATGEPVARRMLVSVPMVENGNFVGTQVKPLNADFLEVARMFGPLAVTLSIITPKKHPMFREIFKVGNPNNDSLMLNTPITDHGTGQFTVLLSRKFKEARRILYKKGIADSSSKENAESTKKTTADTILTIDEVDLFLANSPIIEVQTTEDVENIIPILVQEPVIPHIEADENMPMNLPPVIQHAAADENMPVNLPPAILHAAADETLPMNVFDDIMAELRNDSDIFLPRKKAKTTLEPILEEDSLRDNFQPDQPILLDGTVGQVRRDIAASTSTAGEGSSRGPSQEPTGNVRIVNPILGSNSGLFLPLNSANLCHQPSGGSRTTDRLGAGNSMFPNPTGNSPYKIQSCSSPSFPVTPYGDSSSHQPFQRHRPFEMTGLTPLGMPTYAMGGNFMNLMHRYNQRQNWPHPPPLIDIQNYVHAWEGCLVAKIHANRSSLNQAKALRIPTSPVTLTVEWSRRLEIALFLPKKAVNHTMKICHGPIHFMFFHLTQFNNLDMYDHLVGKNLCAKIELPSQALILSTTESKHHYLGIVFPGDTIFVEPL